MTARARRTAGILSSLAILTGIPVIPGTPACAAWDLETLAQITTAKGELAIVQAGLDGYQLVLDGRVLRELEGYGVRVATSLPAGRPAEYVLIVVDTGGGSCPERFRILDLRAAKPYLSPEFGGCSEYPSIASKGAEIEIDFPAFEQEAPATWLYDEPRQTLQRRAAG
ncbi:MAG TPA: hypothetical protein VMU17_06380 [Elusimicrobiota bacterium]|nr:hypothetical protein [Elusimicrobiota bacterium]